MIYDNSFHEYAPPGRLVLGRVWHGLHWAVKMTASRLTRGTALGVTGEDTQCYVTCACGQELSISDSPSWCLKCGRGYVTDFVIREIPRWLRPSPRDLRRMIAREEEVIAIASRSVTGYNRGMLPFYESDLEKLRAQTEARERGEW